MAESAPCVLVVSAHAGDFVWRAGGAIAAATMRGERAVIVCLSYGERGESASQWLRARASMRSRPSDAVRPRPRHPLWVPRSSSSTSGTTRSSSRPKRSRQLVDVYRRVQPTVVLTHALSDPYNGDHPAAARMALQARILAQAIGVANSDGSFPSADEIIGAPPVFFFEPHQPEQSDFKPNVLLDITAAFPRKRAAMECLPAQKHMWSYYTRSRDPPRRAGQAQRRPEPRPAARDDGRGVRAVLPAGDGRPRMSAVSIVTDIARRRSRDRCGARRVRRRRPCTRRSAASATRVRASARSSRARASSGTAITVLTAPGDNLMVHAAIEQAQEGDIIVVVPMTDSAYGFIGELMATADAARGACARYVTTRRRARYRRAARHGLPGVDRARQLRGHGQGHCRLGQRAGDPRRRRGATPATSSSPTTTA